MKKLTIKTNHLELFSFITLLLWVISPLVEYINRLYGLILYTNYFSNITYLIGILGIITYIIYFIKFKRKEKINIKQFIPEILLIILLFLSIIASIISKNPQLSFFGESYRKEGLIVYIMYIGVLLMSSIIKDSKYIKYLTKIMITVCLIVTINPLFRNDFSYVGFTNMFYNTNHYGYYLMINTMLALFMFINSNKLIKNIIYMIIYIFFLYLLIRNDTFGSYLAIFATLIFLFIYSMIIKNKRIKVISIIILFILTSYTVSYYDIKIGERLNFTDTSGIIFKNLFFFKKDIKDIMHSKGNIPEETGSYRIVLWQEAWKYTLNHPLFGGGMECLKDYYIKDKGKYYNVYNDRPHNSILQVSTFIGIPGAIIYLTLILYIAISNLKILKHNNIHIMIYCTAMCYFLSSLLGNSMYYTSPYFMILLGLLISFNRNKSLTNDS